MDPALETPKKSFRKLVLIAAIIILLLLLGLAGLFYSGVLGSKPQSSNTTQPKTVVKTTPIAETNFFVVSPPVDLSQITAISKYRSCAGHDYRGTNIDGVAETNRSMKHYFQPIASLAGSTGKVKVLAPFDGTILDVLPEHQPRGQQIWLTPSFAQSFSLIFFHTDLVAGIIKGSSFKAGDLIGFANLSMSAHDFDIAIDKPVHNQPSGNMVLDSVFLHMDTETLGAFAARGVSLTSIIISKEERDKIPCTFDRLIPSDWVNLN